MPVSAFYLIFSICTALGSAAMSLFADRRPALMKWAVFPLIGLSGVCACVACIVVLEGGAGTSGELPFGLPWLPWHIRLDSLSSFFQMSVLPRRKYFDLGFLVYSGLGYINKTYDKVENPTNLAISTHLNITADLRYFVKIRIHPVYLEYSRGLNHFSNGIIKAPNLGINVKNNNFTLGYEFEEQPVYKKIPKPERNKEPRHEFWIYGAMGVKEVSGLPGKSYVSTNASINYTYRTTAINKMGIGLDFVYDPSLEDYAYLTYSSYNGEPSLNFRSGVSLHNEFVFKRTGLFTSYGLNFKMNEFYARQRYYKVGLKFYFKNVVGVVLLRAIPLFRADLLELGVGYRIPVKSKKAKNGN